MRRNPTRPTDSSALPSCSRENALGACAFTLAGVTQTGWYYDDDSGITLADIQSLCAGGGATFVPP